jgi:hypothetical protein
MFPFEALKLGKIEYSSRKRALFQCKKDGFAFLGQAKLCPIEKGIIVELFNESFWERFRDKEDVLKILEENLLQLLKTSNQIPPNEHENITALWENQKLTIIEIKNIASNENLERDLTSLFNGLNKEYFANKVEAQIEWGKGYRTGARRSFRFGSYDIKKKRIRINPALRKEFVPHYVLELTVFHEMCHQFVPPIRNNGKWRVHHPEFKKKEREYQFYREALLWEKQHWKELIAAN